MSTLPSSTDDGSPQRFIYSDNDLESFLQSPVKAELLRFTSAMGRSCSDAGAPDYVPEQPLRGLTPAFASLHGSLTVMAEEWIDEIQPVTTNAAMIRFGNPAFQTWHERLKKRSEAIVQSILHWNDQHDIQSSDYDEAVLFAAHEAGKKAASESPSVESRVNEEHVVELKAYLEDSFGHPIRLDYGTGHESSFQVFLFCLCCRLHCCGSSASVPPSVESLKAMTLSLYHAYLKVTRKLQTIYRLEPAGSHGVWGLDDYYCLAFYFGACQMQTQSELPPSSIHDLALLEENHEIFLYFGCIRFIRQVKQGVPFFETSPMLHDISNSLPTWSKVAGGLLKLYEGEVLKKRPVVQHFRFGKLFAANWTASPPPKEPPRDRNFVLGDLAGGSKAPWAK